MKDVGREERGLRRDEFLKAAVKRFSQQGYAATSTREICADLGLAHSAIYNHFRSKEEVLLAIEKQEMQLALAELQAVLADARGEAPCVRLERAISYTMGAALRRRDAWTLLRELLKAISPANRTIVLKRRDQYQKIIRELIQDCIEMGDIPPQDFKLTANYMFDIASGIAFWYKPRGRLSAATVIDNATAFIMGGVRYAREKPV